LKHTRQKKNRKIQLGAGIIAIIFGAAIVCLLNLNKIIFYISPNQVKIRENNRFIEFPETIGVYKLNKKEVYPQEKCDDLQNHSDTKDIIGKVCQKSASADYRDPTTQKAVFVHVISLTEGKAPFVEAVKKFGTPETLGGYNIVRMEKAKISWFPKADFDFVSTEEGIYISNSNGDESMSYDEEVSGSNEVTQYFMKKYVPNVWFSN
jgi:hypothetical protein